MTAAGAVARLRRMARRLRWRTFPRFERLDFAPEDLTPVRPGVADDILDSIFEFDGVAVDCHGRSPFAVVPPSPDWERGLHRFGWLRHLAASQDPAVPERARVLLAEWSRYGSMRPVSGQTDVMADRLVSWLHEAPVLLAGATAGQSARIIAHMEDESRRLFERLGEGPAGLPRLHAALALAQVAVSTAGAEAVAAPVLRRIDRDLARFVLPDGVTADRNPESVMCLLADLLPLRQVLTERGLAASRTLMNSIDRLLPSLRFFRHSEGSLALFNGAGPVAQDHLAAVFLLDDARARPPGQAVYGGYQRLEGGRTVVLMDTGAPPPLALSLAAHAAPLAMEMSSGANRFIVSTGTAADPRPDWRQSVRETSAHSAVVIGGRSCARFRPAGGILGGAIASRPWSVTVARKEVQGTTAVVASHDGYLAATGLTHERTLRLSAAGDRLDGRDRTIAQSRGQGRRVPLALRFHLHPDIHATRLGNGAIQLIAPDGEAWEFHVRGASAALEPSVFLGNPVGPRACDQIVAHAAGATELRWLFLRTAEPRARRRGPFEP